jgi:DNA-binding response OmpR family regulator
MAIEPRILIVEDDHSIRDFLSIALTDEGYRVVAAEDGLLGLSLIPSFQPHLILLDMNLPVINGLDFMAIHRGLPQPAPIIGISAVKNAKSLAESQGIADFLEKPFSLDDLFERIHHFLADMPIE